MGTPPLKVFCSYSHKDEEALDQLRRHLAGLRRQGLIADWHDRQIPPGGDWDATIKAELEAADLILLLVSADFIASDYCMKLETARALQRDQDGTATVIPLFWRECVVDGLPFTYLQGTPKDMRWISQQPDRDKAWAEVVATIRSAADNRLGTGEGRMPYAPTPDTTRRGVSHTPSSPPRWKYPLLIVAALLLAVSAIWYGAGQQREPVGETLLQQGEYQQAQQECAAALPSSARERCLRITSLMLEPREVEKFYADASREDSAYALTVMGEAEAAQQDFANAQKHYSEAIERNPAIAQAYYGMGQIQQLQNQPDAAFNWYKQAVERAPQNRRFILNLASVYAERGDLVEAESHYRNVLALDNSTLLAYLELIGVLQRQQKTADARELAQTAQQGLTANPDWKDKPLNQQEWFIMQDGQPVYLQTWEDKQAYLLQVVQQASNLQK